MTWNESTWKESAEVRTIVAMDLQTVEVYVAALRSGDKALLEEKNQKPTSAVFVLRELFEDLDTKKGNIE